MKRILLIVLIFSVQIFSQEKETKEKVNNFYNFLKIYAEDEAKLKAFSSVSDSEIKQFIKLKYEAYCEDSELLYKMKAKHDKELQGSSQKGSRISSVEGMFNNILEEKYSVNLNNFLRISYLLRATITSVKDSVYKYKLNDFNTFSLPVTELEFKVDEVVKGNNDFKKGNIYKCYYAKRWSSPYVKFIPGEAYLLPLEPRGLDNEESTSNTYSIMCFLDDNKGCYKIENGYLMDKYNFFSFGKEVSWKDFIEEFNKKIDQIKKGEF